MNINLFHTKFPRKASAYLTKRYAKVDKWNKIFRSNDRFAGKIQFLQQKVSMLVSLVDQTSHEHTGLWEYEARLDSDRVNITNNGSLHFLRCTVRYNLDSEDIFAKRKLFFICASTIERWNSRIPRWPVVKPRWRHAMLRNFI